MAIRAGQILHFGNTFLIDRIQAAGPGNLNIPTERIQEVGNYETVAVVRDIPDLTFNLEVLDVSTEVEAIVTGQAAGSDPESAADGSEYNLTNNVPIDIISPFKSAQGQFDVVSGVATPQLTLESASYRYGLRENAGETYSLRGDSIFYIPGTPYVDTFAGGSTTYNFTNGPALVYTEQGQSIYALNVSVNGVRQTRGTHYTDSATGVTFTTAPTGTVRLVYGSATAGNYPQTVHQGVAVKPAAIRGKDINLYISDGAATPTMVRWTDVQSVTVDWRVTLEDDFEFGNPRAVDRSATDVPALTGTVEIKPITAAELLAKLRQITGVATNQVIGPQSAVSLPMEVRLLNPASGGSTARAAGDVVKTLYVADARFSIPGYEGRVQQKMVNQLQWESDSGVLRVYKGARP